MILIPFQEFHLQARSLFIPRSSYLEENHMEKLKNLPVYYDSMLHSSRFFLDHGGISVVLWKVNDLFHLQSISIHVQSVPIRKCYLHLDTLFEIMDGCRMNYQWIQSSSTINSETKQMFDTTISDLVSN